MNKTTTMRNVSASAVRFRIAGAPGQPVTRYDVAPGETCEVPEGYVLSGHIRRIAPGLEPEPASSSPSSSAAPGETPPQSSSPTEPAAVEQSSSPTDVPGEPAGSPETAASSSPALEPGAAAEAEKPPEKPPSGAVRRRRRGKR